ncbi:MAG: hypothetical protein AOA65_1365 [Candidatus Bathyarchaeota archaeon BA1]|nr:MAG: hypothetical protein AOA65_1365 [Candidatus Bathyarchaeota archaeon BA1]
MLQATGDSFHLLNKDQQNEILKLQEKAWRTSVTKPDGSVDGDKIKEMKKIIDKMISQLSPKDS